MEATTLLSLALFAGVSSITPGPNNLMLLASGVNFGWKRTVPHILGISTGFALLLFAVGMGLGSLFVRWHWLQSLLHWGSMAYLIYLAWQIAGAGAVGEVSGQARPMRWRDAALFQWVNPKCWIMALGAFSAYVPAGAGWMAILLATLVFAAINLPCVSCWALLGNRLRKLLSDPVRRRRFNWLMAALLLASLYPVLLG
ncbi:LysE family translocator [Chitinimonas sp.]|uniref:LysE family translocator n=1 Tax=Chitinimonas sp. TaxID=1934313 RepID=UPI0035B30EB4